MTALFLKFSRFFIFQTRFFAPETVRFRALKGSHDPIPAFGFGFCQTYFTEQNPASPGRTAGKKAPAMYSPVGQSADSIHNGDVLFRAASSAVRSLTLQHFRCSALTDRRGGPHG